MSGATVKAALAATLTSYFASDTAVQVSAGYPGDTVMDDVIAVLGVTNEPDGEEDAYRVSLIVACNVGGGVEAQATATARAYSLLESIRTALQAAPTLSAACRLAVLSRDHACEERVGLDLSGTMQIGWMSTIEASVRIWTGTSIAGSLAQAVV